MEKIFYLYCVECTNRGIIIRHEEKGPFKLFKTKLVKKGKGSDEYYYFEDDNKPYCEGINEIKSYLDVKNKDKNIEDKDAYFVITGNLKIFEFIQLDKDKIWRIEFIDLPGVDRMYSAFNKKEYYKNILNFSSCIYIYEPKSKCDEQFLNSIMNQYIRSNQKINRYLRPAFIKTCMFLINKIDFFDDEPEKRKEKIRIKNYIFKNISLIEKKLKKEDINISCFSGKYFLEYLNVMYFYVDILDKQPRELFSQLYDEYRSSIKSLPVSFKAFIFGKISIINEDFSLNNNIEEGEEEEEEEEIEPPEAFKNKIKTEIELFEKDKEKLFKNQEDFEVIKRLYNLYIKLKNKGYSDGIYSNNFFDDLKIIIERSTILFKENFKKNIIELFRDIDILFRKEHIDAKNEEWNKIKIKYEKQKENIIIKLTGILE